jgi:flagellar hook-associated protein 2
MGGITSGIGVFSGIDSGSIIDQLLAIEGRPKQQFQTRISQLQSQKAAFLDLNSKLSALRSAAASFRDAKSFQLKTAISSNKDVLSATAQATAVPGSYTFLVDQLVTSQQNLSRGFVDSGTAAIGATSLSFETARARLDRDLSLSDLNDGQGVSRGKIVVTDAAGHAATVDLSRAITVQDVLDSINNNGTALVTASVKGGKFVITDTSGGGGGTTAATVTNAAGFTTADSLGLTTGSTTASNVRSSTTVFGLNANTSLRSFNDGNGVSIKPTSTETDYQFNILVHDGGVDSNVHVNLGDVWTGSGATLTRSAGAVTTASGVIDRINEALDKTNGRIVITDATGTRTIEVQENGTGSTAADLGLKTTAAQTGVVNGRMVLAGLNSTLATSLNGGAGVTGDGVLHFTSRDGSTFDVTLGTNSQRSLSDIADAIESAAGNGGKIKVALNSRGTGLQITDTTGGVSNLIITGTGGADSAASLGISTGAGGVAASTKAGTNLQHQYISRGTLLADLPLGRALGTGVFRITDSASESATVDIGTDSKTLGDIIDEINSKNLTAKARINSNGDGIEIYEQIPSGGTAGATKIKIEDVSGSVGSGLNLVGTASDVGTLNKINGTFERSVTLTAADTLQQIAEKINSTKVGMTAAVIRDGNGSASYRLSLAAGSTGVAGRVIIDGAGTDLNLQTLDAGRDARVFFGSSDPARGVAVTSSTNTIDSLVPGVKIDLKSTSASPVTLTVNKDQEGIEAAVGAFIKTFNTLANRIDDLSKYDDTSKRKGALLGDGTSIQLRGELYSIIQGRAIGSTGSFDSFADVGITIGTGGDLTLNSEKFRAALAQDAASVESLFTARTQIPNATRELSPGVTVRDPNPPDAFSSLGIAGRLEQLGKKYLDVVDGVLTRRGQDIDTQITQQNNRIDALDLKLESKRQILTQQFAMMESAIGALQQQQNALGSLSRAG